MAICVMIHAPAVAEARPLMALASDNPPQLLSNPASDEATPVIPAAIARYTKNPVAAFPIGKYIGDNCTVLFIPGPISNNINHQPFHH
ncbi:hypothetical protein OROHE_010321 [Orobanche hederae]